MYETLKTHYYFYSNEEGDGYEVYFCDYPEVRAFGDTYEEAYQEALSYIEPFLQEKEVNDKQLMADALHAYEKKIYKKAIEIWEKLAATNSDAMVNLGSLYAKGEGVAKDVSVAKSWFEKAVQKGHDVAAFYLGGMYENGIGVKKDDDKAIEYYKKVAYIEDFTTAKVKLALLLKDKDTKEAMSLLIAAAHKGDSQAQDMITYVSNWTQAKALNQGFRGLSETEQKNMIGDVIDKVIVPMLAADGGGASYVNYIPGNTPQIWLQYLGTCSGCHLGSTSTADMIITALEEAIDKNIIVYLW